MKPQNTIPPHHLSKSLRATAESSVRCNQNHSRTRRLQFNVSAYECNGCAAFYSTTQVMDALNGPVKEINNGGGVVRIA